MTAALLPIDQPAPAAEGVQKTCLIPVDHRHWYCAIFCGLTGVCRKTVVFSTARSHHRAAASRPDEECHARRDLSEGIHAGPHNGNQERELTIVAERMGAEVTIYRDHGISGTKGRDTRPAFDRMCKEAARRQFTIVMAWSVDRLGRSLQDLVGFLGEMHALGVDVYLHQQGLDTRTPAGTAMFQMSSLFAEFERSTIRERVRAGLRRASAYFKDALMLKEVEVPQPLDLSIVNLVIAGGPWMTKPSATYQYFARRRRGVFVLRTTMSGGME